MSLDTATVRRIARLARIRVEDDALPRLQGELNGILGWIEQLSEVDVEGVAPLTGGAADRTASAGRRGDGWRRGRRHSGQCARPRGRVLRRAESGRMMLCGLTIAEAAAALRRRDFTARELTDAHLAAVAALNPQG